MTTHEEIALPPKRIRMKNKDKVYFPHDKGCWNNMVEGMCTPTVDSLVVIEDV